jgi:hypothetical protein
LKLLDDSRESKTYQAVCPLSFLENQEKDHIFYAILKKNLARKKKRKREKQLVQGLISG